MKNLIIIFLFISCTSCTLNTLVLKKEIPTLNNDYLFKRSKQCLDKHIELRSPTVDLEKRLPIKKIIGPIQYTVLIYDPIIVVSFNGLPKKVKRRTISTGQFHNSGFYMTCYINKYTGKIYTTNYKFDKKTSSWGDSDLMPIIYPDNTDFNRGNNDLVYYLDMKKFREILRKK